MTAAVMDSILSYHLNPLTCGIAKFNLCLGDHLHLPVLPLFTEAAFLEHPLLSLKVSEFTVEDRPRLSSLAESYARKHGYDAFFHEYLGNPLEYALARGATGPTPYMREWSPCQPSRMAVTSILAISPSRSARSEGMPWQTT